MINVTRSSMPSLQEYMDEIAPLWESHWLTNAGKIHNELELQLKKYLGADNLLLTVNGHMALELAIQALELKGEIITTPFTFVSTTNAIIRTGNTPVFCDINRDDYTIDATKIEDLITDNTVAIMPVHVYGNVCNVEEIDRIAQKYNLKVIYDAAHTFGVTYKGKGLASYGDVVCYSFHATKVFNTIEGGAVCFKDDELTERIKALRDFGIVDEETTISAGGNAKMNEFAAAMGICNLRHVTDEIEKRRIIEKQYREYLSNVDGIILNIEQYEVVSNSAYFPIIVDSTRYGISRDELQTLLLSYGINARKYFYPLTNDFDYVDSKWKTPIASEISDKVLTLPLYADLKEKDVKTICDCIVSKVYRK